jgi:hypothetical protein
MAKVFISYSWDSDPHKIWARELATRLSNDGVEVTLDQWHLVPGDQLTEFMEGAVRDSDFVLIICTRRYKQRADKRTGGVGYEGDIITGEVLSTRNQRKFIPILREGSWAESSPTWLNGKYYVDLSGSPYSEDQYKDLVNTLLGTRAQPPATVRAVAPTGGGMREAVAAQGIPELGFEPIKITGIIVDQVGVPKNDGTRGSALYRVPFRLSRRPPAAWEEIFVATWNHPPEYTTMHRPGIASVVGETVVLDGTTLEEVEGYHRKTLMLATKEANRLYEEMERREEERRRQEKERADQHRRSVEQAAKRIQFDE